MNRCYGNPVPRRNQGDNSTDMTSFPFVRHHFLRAGFEIVDCPPLTQQLKNSSDIRMVMDVRDYLLHAGAASPAGARPPHRDLRE